ncbi:cold-shock protein [Ornithinibacillus gellani]|uniref:cold-shock protein n=1 Tax=Ornithinibacillus gellani TaxID=2293253 RepID=UPI000F4A0696|nr:cold-shock protein [Ornithinibacillus gellani]TQS74849.1 cold-shock protein [Ornithinibacillus gellani]
MSFSRGPKEPVPEVETKIWVCSSEDCNGWMRESYSFETEPACPFCKSSMHQEVRMLPELD